MRPKKVILCVDADEDRLGRMALVLSTWGYRVVQTRSASMALALIKGAVATSVDALVVEAELLGAENLIAQGKALAPMMGTMLLGYTAHPQCVPTQAHVFLPRILCIPAEIRERLKVLLARKRGPRKIQIPTQSTEAVA